MLHMGYSLQGCPIDFWDGCVCCVCVCRLDLQANMGLIKQQLAGVYKSV